MKILFVEDNEEFQLCVVRDYLFDHEVDSAYDGSEGIKLFDHNFYDLVLLDYQMDQVHGPDVVSHIREVNKLIPVIAVSMEDRLNEELLKLGATAALAKRHMTKLVQLIQEIVVE